MVAVGVFAIPGGVVAAGALLHGNGGYGWALLGEFAGLALAVPLATVVRSTLAAGLILGVLPVVGTVTAYELTSDVVAPVPPPTDRPAVTPSVALGPHGAVLGLGGRF